MFWEGVGTPYSLGGYAHPVFLGDWDTLHFFARRGGGDRHTLHIDG